MKQNRVVLPLALLLVVLSWPGAVRAQSDPTAIQRMQLSAFGGLSAVYTGLGGGRNVGLTAGADLALPPVFRVRPTVEVRGTYPMDSGSIVSQKDALAGLRVDFLLGHRMHPYGDLLFGRGEMNYNSGYFYGNYEYDLTTTWVYSPGGGVDFDLGEHFGVKADGQFQKWGSAPTASGNVYSKVVTVAVVYRFNFNRGGYR